MARNKWSRPWGDADRYWGPFTWNANSAYVAWGFSLYSGDEEDPNEAGLRLYVGRRVLILALPGWLVRPERTKVRAAHWDEATVARLGCNWYWDVKQREYGVTLSTSGGVGEPCMMSVHYGRQTHDSSTEQSWTWFLPWTEWRHVRRTLYGADGSVHQHLEQGKGVLAHLGGADRFDYEQAVETGCPARKFSALDFDMEPVTATVRIEEREWRAGAGWWRWLEKVRKQIVQRYVNVRFDRETGRRKGSWKGGTIESSGPCKAGENHEVAFRVYCVQREMTFVGEVV